MRSSICIQELARMYESGMSLNDISNECGIGSSYICKRLKKFGVDTGRSVDFYRGKTKTYKIDDHIFDVIDTQEKAYILGFLFSDGCMYSLRPQVRLKLQDDDKYILEDIKRCLLYDKPLLYSKAKSARHKDQYMLVICNKYIYNALLNLGLFPNKTFNCKFPVIPDALHRHFIRGYFDGNGCIYVGLYKGADNVFSEIKIVATTDICNSMSDIFYGAGISSTVRHDKRVKDGVDFIRIRRHEDMRAVYDFMYSDASIFLYRKKKKFEKYFDMRELFNSCTR